ncbi:MAG TPA: colicin V production protein [Prolixibacteraceae bacterium]|nr:colicin V production protein [Prolixibacteraceae bacterium]
MNYLDIILLILLLLSAINGFKNGFVEELAGLVALILGIWAAIKFSAVLGGYITETFQLDGKYVNILAFIGIFIFVIILINIIGALISNLVKAIKLNFINRFAGLFFGALKGILILSVFLVVINKIDQDVHLIPVEAKNNSRMFKPAKDFAPSVFPFLDFWGDINKEDTTGNLQ